MKMESEISSPIDAKVAKIVVKERVLVQEGDILIILEGGQVKPASKPARKPSHVQSVATIQPASSAGSAGHVSEKMLKAPIPGTIIEVKVNPGQTVNDGDVAVVLEAMKMESDIHFNSSGKVKKIHVNRGDSVQEGDLLIELED